MGVLQEEISAKAWREKQFGRQLRRNLSLRVTNPAVTAFDRHIECQVGTQLLQVEERAWKIVGCLVGEAVWGSVLSQGLIL